MTDALGEAVLERARYDLLPIEVTPEGLVLENQTRTGLGYLDDASLKALERVFGRKVEICERNRARTRPSHLERAYHSYIERDDVYRLTGDTDHLVITVPTQFCIWFCECYFAGSIERATGRKVTFIQRPRWRKIYDQGARDKTQ